MQFACSSGKLEGTGENRLRFVEGGRVASFIRPSTPSLGEEMEVRDGGGSGPGGKQR